MPRRKHSPTALSATGFTLCPECGEFRTVGTYDCPACGGSGIRETPAVPTNPRPETTD